MTATPPKPNLVKSTALSVAQTATNRLNSFLPTVPSAFSPVTVYQAGTLGVGAQMSAPTSVFPVGAGYYGVWTAPDLNSGRPYTVQVECFGGGGGGGGGSSTSGGGGGGGGEYAAETAYPVVPGKVYAWTVGPPGSPGTANSSGSQAVTAGGPGGNTIFDLAGSGVAGGVTAHGAQGGDTGNTGNGGLGGSSSFNTTAFTGGPGGTNLPGTGGGGSGGQGGTDSPATLATAGLLSIPAVAWYVLNDASSTGQLNDSTGSGNAASVAGIGANNLVYAQPNAPHQVPAYTGGGNPPGSPNPTVAGTQVQFPVYSLNQASGYILTPALNLQGASLTVSGWVTPDASAVWGNPVAGSRAVIAANCTGYADGSNGAGLALYFRNNGTQANPLWQLVYYCGNGTISASVTDFITPVPGTPVYVVVTFNSGTMHLFVNGLFVAGTTVGFTSLPVSAHSMTFGLSPGLASDWFFGYMSNLWLANGILNTQGISRVYNGSGGSSTAGGAGGGASGGPDAIGGAGGAGSGSAGGAGGTPAVQPSTAVGLSTPASAGIGGAVSGAGNSGITGAPGAGGGAAGKSTSPPAVVTLQVPFTTAASYCGTDASGIAPGSVYNPVLQGTTGHLFAGGKASDSTSGSKNSLLILPPNLSAQLHSGSYSLLRVTLTVTSANPQAVQSSLLQVGWSADTFLPVTYTAADTAGSAGVVEIPAGSYTVTADLTESQLGTYLQNGGATALVLGPGSAPGFAAYNTSTAADFYSVIYGPGATDSAGSSLAPYLTITLAQTTSIQQGSPGGAGAIRVTYLNQAQTLSGEWTAADGINASGGQLTETSLVFGATVTDAARPALTESPVRGALVPGSLEAAALARRGGTIRGAPGAIFLYHVFTASVTQTVPGSYSFTVPAGVTSLAVECWGAGAGATGGSFSTGQGAGGGGAYAGEPNYQVAPGDVIFYTVGAGGAGTAVGTSGTPDGAATQFDTSRVAGAGVLANGGQHYQSAFNYGPGGPTSGNTVSFSGGNGGPLLIGQANGSGGGGSAGTLGNGSAGSLGGAAGAAGAGGGAAGGAGSVSGNGTSGSAPGAGGGGASAGSPSLTGGSGANGEISFTYVTATSLRTSLAVASGTDAAGNPYPEGIMTDAVTFNQNNAGFTNGFIGLVTASAAQLTMASPANVISGHTDSVGFVLSSSTGVPNASANAQSLYTDLSGGVHFHAHWDCAGFTIAAGSVNAVAPNTGSITLPAGVESPHVATMINSWAGSGSGVNGFFYWVDPDITASPAGAIGGQLHLLADIINPGATGTSIVTTLPAGWRPVVNQNFQVSWQLVGNPGSSAPWGFIQPNGNVSLVGLTTANVETFFHAIIPMGPL